MSASIESLSLTMSRRYRMPYRIAGQVIGYVEEWRDKRPPDAITSLIGDRWYVIETLDGKRVETGNGRDTAYQALRRRAGHT